MPWRDWQFWFVSALALLGVWTLARPFLSRRATPVDSGCPNCATGSAAAKPRRVALTVEKKRV